jgi:anti-sigma factor RsiW
MMTCDEVRPLLAELAERGLRSAGPVEVHLATCAECAEEFARYRTLLKRLDGLRDEVSDPREGLLPRLLFDVPEEERPGRLRRIAGDERVHYAALSLGGAVVGATAVGLIWWRRSARRSLVLAGGRETASSS